METIQLSIYLPTETIYLSTNRNYLYIYQWRLFVYLSIYQRKLSIYISTNGDYPSIYLSTNENYISIYQCKLSIYLPMNTIFLLIYLFIYLPTEPFYSIIYLLSTYISIYISTYIYLSIYLPMETIYLSIYIFTKGNYLVIYLPMDTIQYPYIYLLSTNRNCPSIYPGPRFLSRHPRMVSSIGRSRTAPGDRYCLHKIFSFLIFNYYFTSLHQVLAG